jgi:thioredoxin reductase (NADPH)
MDDKIHNLIIVGAGPAGIATAVESYILGIRDILLLEKDQNHNSTIRKYYKDKKRVDKDWKGQKVELDGNIYFVDGTKESTLDFFDDVLKNHSVELITHTEVQKILKKDNYFEVFVPGGIYKSKFVVVTIGRMGKPNKPDYKIPASLKKRVNFTLDECKGNEKILIVGGGDSALEYALDLASTNDVTISYRKKEFHRANPTNKKNMQEAIKQGKIKALLGTNILGLEDENGKVKVIFKEIESEVFDRVIYAIGGTTPTAFLQNSGIKVVGAKPFYDENYMTNIEGIYVAGDITQERGGSIALGLNHGFHIAKDILKKLKPKEKSSANLL